MFPVNVIVAWRLWQRAENSAGTTSLQMCFSAGAYSFSL